MEGRKAIKSCLSRRSLFAGWVYLIVLGLFAGVANGAEPNLVSWWNFDEGSGTTAYDSASDNDGTITGATWTAGLIEGALSFDGSGDYVKVNDSSSMRSLDGSTAEYTISLWVKTTQTGAGLWNQKVIFERRATNTLSGKNHWVAHIYLNENNATGFLISEGGSNFFLNDTMAINDGDWHHITATRKNTEYVRVYVDGALRVSGSTSLNPSTTEITTIAVRRTNGNKFKGYFKGKIDDVRIYDIALSAEEIWQLCQEGWGGRAFNPEPEDGATSVGPDTVLSWFPGKDAASHDVYFGTDYNDVNNATTDSAEYMGNQYGNSYYPGGLEQRTTYYWRIDEVNGLNTWKGDVWSFTTWALVSWWKFDEGQGDMAYDSAGENDGTVYGAQWTTGQVGGALSFDGLNDYINVAHSPDFDIETGFTVELWFKAKPTQFSPDRGFTIIDKSHGIGASGWFIQGNLDIDIGPVGFGVGNGTWHPGVNARESILDDVWHHIAGVFDGSNVRLYLDGVLEGSAGFSGTPVNNTGPLNIGRWATGATRNFNGHIDEVAIYNRALSTAEIGRLYRLEFLWRRWGLIGWPDPHLLPGPGHYHLLRTSPCVDAANDANVYTDIEGNIRPFDFPGVDNNGELPEFDMGAYELTPVEAEMQLTPQKLNCKSKGNFVKAHITLPEGFAPEDVALDTPALAYPVNLESEYLEAFVNDYGLVEIEVAFDRRSFCDSLTDDSFVTEDGYLNVTVLGSLTTGQYFYGADTIRIMSRR